ncbi:hemerythrin domain-containing protein [Zoogloea sp.]|uniref:hemerythrin domain-containing protein n=1 Tax=Zoogloea sp. TaxID=49181 RepID=UPI0026326B6D|nr:hemerythrin domain-containing protein [Zoogloea sp.]MDD3353170.1 cation-binding hemerythrin HHE [Zoogloea sp.]
MAAMEMNEKLTLGLGPMDQTHQDFVDAYNALLGASGQALLDAMDAFIAHSVEHFDQENLWMEKIGFPGCHKAEHDRVLAVCRDVRKRLERGDTALVRQLIQEIPVWFGNHVSSMDAALAAYIQSIGFDTETGEIRNPAAMEGGGCGGAPATEEACHTPQPA